MALLLTGRILGGISSKNDTINTKMFKQVTPKPSKMEPWDLQNPAWSSPRCYLLKTFNLRSLKRGTILRFWRPKWPIPLNSPWGGPPPPPHLCAGTLGDCHALKACICRTASPKAHGEMKAHILATICLHVVGKQGGRLS